MGVGGVGRAFIDEFSAMNPDVDGTSIRVAGLADTSGWFGVEDPKPCVRRKASGRPLAALGLSAWTWPGEAGVLVDASTGDRSGAWHDALNRGWGVVSANKTPVADGEADWADRWRAGDLELGATVGAGVPSAAALRRMLDGGDVIHHIEGVVSGTLSTVLAAVASGASLAASVADAHRRGITEPDPAMDLSGRDVARKLTILGKLAGLWDRPPQVQIAPVNRTAIERVGGAGPGLIYVGRADASGVRCGLDRRPSIDPLGRLTAQENAVSFRSRRYDDVPHTIVGPARGPEVTAKTLCADVVRSVRRRLT